MKKLLLIIILMVSLNIGAQTKNDTIKVLRDSITLLKQRVITESQFIQLYKYKSLYKYYRIVINNPSQKKFFWGWSKRTFEK